MWPAQKLIGFIKDTCNPRFHWAKAGWPRYLSCFDGSTVYPDTWCDFGCAAQVRLLFLSADLSPLSLDT